ncbi:hypothetical protein GOBAR_AA13061 [Gossypium barbadense]|uniref:Uncharacterized protein n=1 Tax=Gossypium barbadense TaxID=3634 RepID=A0A2P5XW73_GOSBA|nr:hypothetical protein GOBAR_AA13061 [Gossypium barbadense]
MKTWRQWSLFIGTRSNQNAPIQLFAKLTGVEPIEYPTLLGKEHGAQTLYMVVSITYVDSQSTIHGIDIDLNGAPKISVVGDDVYHNSDHSDHEVDSDSDLDVDGVPDDGNKNVGEHGVVGILPYKPAEMVRSMNVKVHPRRNELFQVTKTIAAYAKVSLNVEQFIDDVFTLKSTLLVWENEFLVLPDLST